MASPPLVEQMEAEVIEIESLAHPFDDEKNWCAPGIFKRPDFDVAGYQKALNKAVGVSDSGHPIVRLGWAWEPKRWQYTDWDEFGNATAGEWRQRYKALTLTIPNTDDYVDISPPRWVLEERFEPAQYEHSWEASRYIHDATECRRCRNQSMGLIEQSTTCTRRDVFGPAPRDGWYNLLPEIGIIAEHDRAMQCCARKWADTKEVCYGRYALPSNRELERLRRAVARRDRDKTIDPHAPLDTHALEEARRWGLQEAQERQVTQREDLKAKIKDELVVHGAGIVPPEVIQALKDTGRRLPKEFSRFT